MTYKPTVAVPRRLAFLSSRQNELTDYRDAATRGIDEYEQFVDVWRFEHQPASSQDPEQIYLEGIRRSDVIIFIACSEASEATATEIVAANQQHKDILCFVLPSNNRAPLVMELISRIRDVATTIDASSDLGEFEVQVSEAVRAWILRRIDFRPSPARSTKLETLRQESHGRITLKLAAAQLDETLAEAIASDIGRVASDNLAPTTLHPMTIILGPVGAGKSITLERIHQLSIEAAQEYVLAPVPVYLKAPDVRTPLRGQIEEACAEFGNLFLTGAAIVIDGLDELSETRASEIYEQAALLSKTSKHSRIVLSSRHEPPDYLMPLAVQLKPMTDGELGALVSRIRGRDVEMWRVLHDLPPSVHEAVHRPLFAIALAQRNQENDFNTGSVSDLVEYLIERGLARSERANVASDELQSLAASVLDSVDGTVENSAVPIDKQEALLVTRLVHERNGRFGFPLRIVAEYAASHFLEKNSVEHAVAKADAPAMVDRWRDALGLYLSRLEDMSALAFVNLLAETDPSLALDFARGDGRTRPQPWTGEELGEALRAAMKGFGTSVPRLVPQTAAGVMPNTLAAVDGRGWAYTGWRDRAGDPKIVTVPPNSIFDHEWELQYAGVIDQARFFANLRAQDDVRSQIDSLLAARTCLVEFAPLTRERIWANALAIVGRGEFRHDPIPLSEIEAALVARPEDVIHIYRSGQQGIIDAKELHAEVRVMRNAASEYMEPPFVTHDQPTSGWVWSGYSPDALLRRRATILKAAMDLYCLLVDTWFGELAKRLRRRLLMPAIIHERVRYIAEGEPVGSRYWEPLREDAANAADIQFGEAYDFRMLATELEPKIAALRSRYLGRIWAGMTDGIIRMWGIRPIRDTAYRWLSEDLSSIGWSLILGLPHDEA